MYVDFQFMVAVIVHSSSLFCQPACSSGSKVASLSYLQKSAVLVVSMDMNIFFLCVWSRGLVVFNGTGIQREVFFSTAYQ